MSGALAFDLAKREHRAPFVIEKWDEAKRRWRARATREALEEAEAYAWARLTRGGGEYRVRQGRRVLARCAGYADRWSPTERTAVGHLAMHLGAPKDPMIMPEDPTRVIHWQWPEAA